jgi:hypothetical protein
MAAKDVLIILVQARIKACLLVGAPHHVVHHDMLLCSFSVSVMWTTDDVMILDSELGVQHQSTSLRVPSLLTSLGSHWKSIFFFKPNSRLPSQISTNHGHLLPFMLDANHSLCRSRNNWQPDAPVSKNLAWSPKWMNIGWSDQKSDQAIQVSSRINTFCIKYQHAYNRVTSVHSQLIKPNNFSTILRTVDFCPPEYWVSFDHWGSFTLVPLHQKTWSLVVVTLLRNLVSRKEGIVGWWWLPCSLLWRMDRWPDGMRGVCHLKYSYSRGGFGRHR